MEPARKRGRDGIGGRRTTRLHVVGCPRSGTTLVAELLATCFEGVGHGEHELSIFRAPPAGHALYVSKKPADVKRIAPILRADPDLFVINVLRDPRAVVTSTLAERSSRYWIGYEKWAQCARAARRLSGHPRFVDVRYEHLVADPDAVQRQLEAQLPFLVRKHTFSHFDRHAQPTDAASMALGGVRPVDATRAVGWRAHLPRVKGELIRHPDMTTVLIELGYEPDASWTGMLDAVAPQYQPRKTRLRRFFVELDADLRYLIKQQQYLWELKRRQLTVPARDGSRATNAHARRRPSFGIMASGVPDRSVVAESELLDPLDAHGTEQNDRELKAEVRP